MNCEGFCAAAASSPWWLMAAQLAAIVVLAWLSRRGWVHHMPARIAAGHVYVGDF